MIGNTLRRFFTACWMAIAYPERNGSSYIQRTLPVCYGGSLAGMLAKVDRDAMQTALSSKYGIREIEG